MTQKNDDLLEKELVLVRIFDAPRELVFKMWTEPRHFAQWWGPSQFTNPVCDLDVRPGGVIRVDMRAPDGTVYPMGGSFLKITPPERLVFTTTALMKRGDEPFLENLNTVTFADLNGKTKLTLHVRVLMATPEATGPLEGMEQGWSESLERLQDLTGAETGAVDRQIVGTRLLDAPRDLVWKVWTEPEHLAPWWGPNGFTSTIQEMDVRPGGTWRLIMHGPDGTDYPNSSVYVEVVKPQLLVYDHVSAPQFHSMATFFSEGNKTRVTVRLFFDTAALRDKTAKEFGAIEGLQQMLERLAEKTTPSVR